MRPTGELASHTPASSAWVELDFAAYAAYVQQVQDGGKELSEIINCVTTNKTSFFREMHHFDFLAQTLVPHAQEVALLGRVRRIRIWSVASSTGEEPYSIAITLIEALKTGVAPGSLVRGPAPPGPPLGWTIEVVASDIDTVVLATATQGVYAEESLQDVSLALQGKYFLRGREDMAGRVRGKKEVRQLVKFQRINLMGNQWPVEGLFDAIFFRNALIYFNRDTQEIFLRKMLRHLRPSGYLILGHSEHVPWLNDAVVALGHTIHQLKPQPRAGTDRRRRQRK